MPRIAIYASSLTIIVLGACALIIAQAPPADDPLTERIRAYMPYDGTGRYTMSADDGVRGIQGLDALASRFGAKPYEALSTDEGAWRAERTIFRDVDTGATVVRLTNDRWGDQLSYFKGNWTADGKQIVFRRRPGMWESSTATHGPMTMRADGGNLRNAFRDYRMVRNEICSPTEPNICYAMANSKQLIAFDVETGITDHVVRDVPGCWHLKISPDGDRLMSRSNIEAGGKGIWIVKTDGSEYTEIAVPEPIHDSYQFHPAGDRVMYWYEATYRAEGFVQRSLDGGPITKTGITFDWNHGDVGLDRGAHTGGYITRIDGDAWLEKEPLFAAPGVEYYDDPHNFNGYLAWLPKDQLWVYSTRIIARPHISEIHAYHADPVPGDVVNRYRLCYTATMRPGCLDNPGASPDGTKVLFNSNMLGSIDAYYVVAKLPETPLDVTAGRDDGSVRIAWEPSPHHLETAGYHVYRSAESGVGYEPITAEPVAATEYVDDDAPTGAVFYAVTAVEHSGIESHLSREAALGSGPRRIYIEAEDGERSQEMWLAHQGLASGLHYVWMRAHEGEGSFSIPVDLDGPERSWSMWARVRGPEGTDFTAQLADGTVTLETLPSDAWSWAQFTGALTAGATQDDLTISSGIYGSAIDSIVLTDDPDFSPEAVDRINVPDVPQVADVLADAISPYDVQVTWTDKRDATFGHYNIYCGPSEDFAPSQATLVGSPDASGHIDWGLAPGTTAFYRVAEVDRWGNEGPASDVAEVTTPAVERVVIEEPSADEVTLSVPADGTHVLWLKLAKGGRGSNYIDVKIDGDSRTWTCGFDGLSDESWFSYGEWGLFGLAAGDHVLTLTNKSEHSVESILLTNDASYQPEGHVNILTGW